MVRSGVPRRISKTTDRSSVPWQNAVREVPYDHINPLYKPHVARTHRALMLEELGQPYETVLLTMAAR